MTPMWSFLCLYLVAAASLVDALRLYMEKVPVIKADLAEAQATEAADAAKTAAFAEEPDKTEKAEDADALLEKEVVNTEAMTAAAAMMQTGEQATSYHQVLDSLEEVIKRHIDFGLSDEQIFATFITVSEVMAHGKTAVMDFIGGVRAQRDKEEEEDGVMAVIDQEDAKRTAVIAFIRILWRAQFGVQIPEQKMEQLEEAKSNLPTLVALAQSCQRSWLSGKSKEEYAAAFVPAESSEQADWVGTYVDMFSLLTTPDPDSRRFIDLDESSGELQISADNGGEKWGRRFNKTTSVNPILVSTDESNARKTSFLSKVPKDAPVYSEAVAGALDFTLIMGTAFGEKVIKWNDLYDGKGGKFGGEDVPASDCGTFWRAV